MVVFYKSDLQWVSGQPINFLPSVCTTFNFWIHLYMRFAGQSVWYLYESRISGGVWDGFKWIQMDSKCSKILVSTATSCFPHSQSSPSSTYSPTSPSSQSSQSSQSSPSSPYSNFHYDGPLLVRAPTRLFSSLVFIWFSLCGVLLVLLVMFGFMLLSTLFEYFLALILHISLLSSSPSATAPPIHPPTPPQIR